MNVYIYLLYKTNYLWCYSARKSILADASVACEKLHES